MAALFTMSDFAERLAVSDRTFSRLKSAGRIPAAVQIGSRPRWRREEIELWIEAGCPDRAVWEAMRDASQGPEGGEA